MGHLFELVWTACGPGKNVQPLHLILKAEGFFFSSCFKCVEAASPDSRETVWNPKTIITLSVAVGFSFLKGDTCERQLK